MIKRIDDVTITCRQCKFWKVRADVEGEQSLCKRIDHKNIQFWKPYFLSYDCGEKKPVCADFEMVESLNYYYLFKDIKPYQLRTKNIRYEYVPLHIHGDESIYYVNAYDFYIGNFLESDGSLKWYLKKVLCAKKKLWFWI